MGAFLDVILVLGLAIGVTVVLDWESVPSVVFLVIALVDWFAPAMILALRKR
jgi:hypothetical protein